MEAGAGGPCGSYWGLGLGGGACRLHYLLPGWNGKEGAQPLRVSLPSEHLGSPSTWEPGGPTRGHLPAQASWRCGWVFLTHCGSFFLFMMGTQESLRGLAGGHHPGLARSLWVLRADGGLVTWPGPPGGRGVLREKGRGPQRPRSQVRCGVFTGSGSWG